MGYMAAASGPGAHQQRQQHSQQSSGAGRAPASAAAACSNPMPPAPGSQQPSRQSGGPGSQGGGSGRPSAGRAGSQHQQQQAAPAAGSNGSMGHAAPPRAQHPSLRDLDSSTRSPQSGSTATLPEGAQRQAPPAELPPASGGGAPAAGQARASAQQPSMQSEGQAGSCMKPSLAGERACSQEPQAPPLSGDAPQPSEQLSMQSTAQRPLAQQQGALAQQHPGGAAAAAPDATWGRSAAGSAHAERLAPAPAPSASPLGTAQGSALASSRQDGGCQCCRRPPRGPLPPLRPLPPPLRLLPRPHRACCRAGARTP
jgi:hypothetical protein